MKKKYSMDQLREMMPDFMDEQYVKGEDKDRGLATVAIALFLLYVDKIELQ